jgi:predicted Rossmann fold nucleotide-binding protein DprA/Smf involved in DNA uptake
MNLSATAQATLLLTCYFSKASKEDAKPLTNVEWGRFALWLKEKNTTPADLLIPDPQPLLSGWHDRQITTDRILALLNRGHSLALSMEKWQRAGLWVITRSDPEYPRRLKARLKTNAPPVLFGCGNRTLLNAGGIAVVGSRNACDADLEFARELGAKAAAQGMAIVSGGARGVDEVTMLSAMQAGGSVIGIMADSLLKAATSAKWRTGLMNSNVVLVSPFYPEAGFSTGNAMARNKYIYCLADTSVVVHSGTKGGTLNGAQENLKEQWVPLWVKPTQDKDAANAMLVNKGGRWCDENLQDLDLTTLFTSPKKESAGSDPYAIASQSMDLFSDQVREPGDESRDAELVDVKVHEKSDEDNAVTDFYGLFIRDLARLAIEPINVDELSDKMGLHKSQVADWIGRSLSDGYVRKLNRPVRYQYIQNSRKE